MEIIAEALNSWLRSSDAEKLLHFWALVKVAVLLEVEKCLRDTSNTSAAY